MGTDWERLMRWYQRLFRRARTEKQLDAELRFHVEQQIADYVATGITPEEARRRARLEFGGLDQVKEKCRDVGAARFIETLIQDVRYGLRQLRRNPGFTTVAVITLALGMGANTAIFSVIDAVMLQMLPVEKPGELMQVKTRDPRFPGQASPLFTTPLWEQLRDRQDVFSGVFAWGESWGEDKFNLSQGGAAHLVNGMWVSGGFFRTLGLHPAAGRLIAPSDDRRGCPAVAVLSYGFWQDHFGGAGSAIGSTISLSSHPFEVIGVAPPGFYGMNVGRNFEVAAPICATVLFDGKESRLVDR
ncbi:MAG: ABC transporter permease, partial [Terriglobia bacterium]